jgi:hypothetical protein
MVGFRLHSLSVAPVAIAGAALLGVSSTTTMMSAFLAGPTTMAADAVLLDTESWIIGGSGLPIPSASYVDAVNGLYIDPTTPVFPGQPVFPVDKANALFTPADLYPLTGVKTLPLDTSEEQGKEILDNTIHQQIAAGNDVVVSGHSQGSTVASLAMRDLLALPAVERPGADQLSFVLLGDPNNPDGGLLSRFDVPGLQTPTIPSLGVTFNGATPAETPWDTAIYTGEYDGFADYPKYPINLLADVNALAGILLVHGAGHYLTESRLATAIPVATSDDYTGNTTYWMIPYPDGQLPLTDLIANIPVVGRPLADLLEPDLEVLVNLGYGPDPDIGWSTTGANLPTPFGLFPSLTAEQSEAILQALGAGAQQGFEAFVGDLSHLSLTGGTQSGSDIANLFDETDPSALPSLTDMPSLTDIVNAFSGAASSAYAALLPTADIVNALTTTAPAFAVSLFAQELAAGDLLDAVGLPLAAVVGLGSFAAGVELYAIANATSGVSDSLEALFS